ncbi:STAS domain-containing protein [Catellatospora coxensis]
MSGSTVPAGQVSWSQRTDDDTPVLSITGELDLAAERDLKMCLARVSCEAHLVVLDLSGVTFIDAHSVGMISRTWWDARQTGVTLKIVGMSGFPARVFAMCGVGKY